MAYGTFRECVDGMNTAMCGAISYLTYVLANNGRTINLVENENACYGYVLTDEQIVSEKQITKIALDENNNIIVYFGDDEFYPLVGMDVQSMQTTYNIVDWLNEL